jgi:hypothetical protein
MVGTHSFRAGLIAIAASGLLAVASAQAASEPSCVVIRTSASGTVLYNTCNVCRTVKVEHRRPGASFPIGRDYPIPAQGRAQLPFRGGGQTRVLSEITCPGAADAAQQQSRGPECVALHNTEQTGPLAVNSCSDCRIAEIERRSLDGGRDRISIGIDARSYVPLKSDSAADVRLLSDRPCR